MKKSDYHHGNLKEDFLQIAFDFIQKEELEKLTLKVLSDATNTSRSAIYRHFESKDALIETMIERGFEQCDARISSILKDREKPLVDRFYLAGKEYVQNAKQNPNLYRLMFGKKYAHIREEIINLKDDDCHGFGALKLAIIEGQEGGLLKKEDAYHQAIVIWASFHGLASLMIDGFMDVEEIYEKIYDDMFTSLLMNILTKKVKILTSLPYLSSLLKPSVS
jgi:AcrR family transcriptional regulator